MSKKYEIDGLDAHILQFLQNDARTPFLEMARQLGVSGGTIHQRVEKLREAGIITGSQVTLDYKELGMGVTVLLGIHLAEAKSVHKVLSKLNKIKEVVEAHYTTGNYALIIKVMTKDIDHFHDFLVNKLQKMEEIQSTESFICLNSPIDRPYHPSAKK